jgi:hypothetical protein
LDYRPSGGNRHLKAHLDVGGDLRVAGIIGDPALMQCLKNTAAPILSSRRRCAESEADSLTLVFMRLGIGMLIPVTMAYNAYQ